MRERAELEGGTFDIQSVINEGTTIRVVWQV
jgi:signal transduction histidine kinase